MWWVSSFPVLRTGNWNEERTGAWSPSTGEGKPVSTPREPDSLSTASWSQPLILGPLQRTCGKDKLPQSRWIKTTEIHSVTVLQEKSPKSRCEQVCSLWGLWGESAPCSWWLPTILGTSWVPWQMVTSLQPPLVFTRLTTRQSMPQVSLSLSLLL